MWLQKKEPVFFFIVYALIPPQDGSAYCTWTTFLKEEYTVGMFLESE